MSLLFRSGSFRVAAVAVLFLAGPARTLSAQHHDHGAPAPHDSTQADPHHPAGYTALKPASATLLPGLPMQRESSGTAWQPDTSPMYAIHARSGGWDLMFHGAAFLRYTGQDLFDSGERGESQFDAPNWFMGMASRPAGTRTTLGLRAMLSLDPITERNGGYPLLFQTGETFEGKALIDRQHPHDFVSELAATIGHSFGDQSGVFAYLAYPGEPALGPPAFMHRVSAQYIADSPLGHHWQDATHIVYGVGTLGFRYGIFKLDGSVFTGREPDEERFGFDRPRFDSYSLRLSANPARQWSLQVSRGYLRSPEVLAPEEDEWRTTASALYNVSLNDRVHWATSLVWGLNESAESGDEAGGHAHGHGPLQALLLESGLDVGRYAVFSRAEWVEKSELSLGVTIPAEDGGTPHPPRGDVSYGIGAWSAGAAARLARLGGLGLSLGMQGSIYRVPEDLRLVYGDFPVSAQVYLRLMPSGMLHDSAS